jgi:hypothetical protein
VYGQERKRAGVADEVKLDVEGRATQRSVLDALEAGYIVRSQQAV